MTETLCLLILAATLILLLFYLEQPRISLLACFQLLALGLISMRISWLPFAVLASVLVPTAGVLWRSRFPSPIQPPGLNPRRGPLPKMFLHLVVSVSVLFLLHSLYLSQGGYFLLAAWAPIVKPQDAPDQLSRDVLAEPSEFEIADPYQRQHQRWAPGGLIPRLRERYGGFYKSNQAAKEMAYRAALRDPWGVLSLSWLLYKSYWHDELYRWTMKYDFDHRPLPERLARILQTHFRLEASDFSQPTIIERYYRRARPWFAVVLLSPLFGLAALCLVPPPARPYAGLLLAAIMMGLSTVCLAALYPSFRYLHQLSWLTLLTVPIVVDRLLGFLEGSAAASERRQGQTRG